MHESYNNTSNNNIMFMLLTHLLSIKEDNFRYKRDIYLITFNNLGKNNT